MGLAVISNCLVSDKYQQLDTVNLLLEPHLVTVWLDILDDRHFEGSERHEEGYESDLILHLQPGRCCLESKISNFEKVRHGSDSLSGI